MAGLSAVCQFAWDAWFFNKNVLQMVLKMFILSFRGRPLIIWGGAWWRFLPNQFFFISELPVSIFFYRRASGFNFFFSECLRIIFFLFHKNDLFYFFFFYTFKIRTDPPPPNYYWSTPYQSEQGYLMEARITKLCTCTISLDNLYLSENLLNSTFKSYNQFLIIKCKVLGYLVHIRGGWINSSHFGVCLNHQLAVWSSCGVFPFTRLTRIVNINKGNGLEQWPHGSTLCPFPSSLKISWFKRVSLNNWLGS